MHLSSTDNPHTEILNIINVDNLKRDATKMSIRQECDVKTLPAQENSNLIADCRSCPELGLIPATVPTEADATENIKVHLSTGHVLADPELFPARTYFK